LSPKNEKKVCPKCGKTENQIKAGFNRSGTQRYKCKECGRTYTLNSNDRKKNMKRKKNKNTKKKNNFQATNETVFESNENVDIKDEVQDFDYSDIAFSIPFANHPFMVNKSLDSLKEKYFSKLTYVVAKVGINSRYSKSIIKLYKRTFGFGIPSNIKIKTKTEVKVEMSPEILSLMYFDLMIISGYDKRYLTDSTLDKIKKIISVDYSDSLRTIYSFSSDLKRKASKFMSDSAWDEIISQSDYKKWLIDIRKNYDYMCKRTYKILVTATMSAGKSTFINALAGRKVAKTLNEACTGRIHHIYSKPFNDGFISKWEDGKEPVFNAKNAIITEDESEQDISSYESVYFLGDLGGKKFEIIDTPGVNSAQHKNHGDITKELLKKGDFDLLIYVINYTVESADDNKNFLNFIKEEVSDDIPKIFVLNKVDRREDDDMKLSDKIKQIQTELIQSGFKHSPLFPLSASAAYFSGRFKRKYGSSNSKDIMSEIMMDTMNPKNMNRFTTMNQLVSDKELHLEKYYKLPKYAEKTIDDKLKKAEKNDDFIEKAAIHSGIYSLISAVIIYSNINNERI
jgi:small GTP-binding protein